MTDTLVFHKKEIVTSKVTDADVLCPVCGSDDQSMIWVTHYPNSPSPVFRGLYMAGSDGPDALNLAIFPLRSCGQCKLLYFQRPPLEAVHSIYLTNTLSSQREKEWVLGILESPSRNELVRAEFDYLLRQSGVRSGRYLDVGSLHGNWLRYGKELGFDGEGIEPDEQLASVVSTALNLKIHQCFLKDLPNITPDPYDLITMVDTLEHHPDPVESMRVCYDLLRPGGILYVSVPNINSYHAQHDINFYPGLEFPSHLNYFSVASLKYLANLTRYEVLALNTFTRFNEIFHFNSVAAKSGRSLGDFQFLDELLANNAHENVRLVVRKPI